MADPTKIPGFRNISSGRQAAFISNDGEVKIRQISAQRWEVLPRGGQAILVRGRQSAIDEARGIKTGLTRSHVQSLMERQRALDLSISSTPKKSAPKKKAKQSWLSRKIFGF